MYVDVFNKGDNLKWSMLIDFSPFTTYLFAKGLNDIAYVEWFRHYQPLLLQLIIFFTISIKIKAISVSCNVAAMK